MTTMTGQEIRGYTIGDVIGQGGFGVVYRAYQEEVKRDVAIKVILPEHANNEDFRQQFQTEAELIARLEHPHIIPLYNYWQDEQGAFLIMRYVAAGTLEELLKEEKSLSWAQAQRIFMQVAEALEVAHDNGVIHRDIKPANILLDERGNAYLTDFGLAWIASNASQNTAVTGTIAYMAPEILKKEPPGIHSDLYALGILLYRMLTGQQPFVGTVSEVIDAHLNAYVPSVFDTNPDLPELVDEVIYRLTEKDPQDRYTSVKALLQTLEDVPVTPIAPARTTISMMSTSPKLSLSSQTRGNTLGLRNRFSMINAVHSYWIQGVLENLLSGYALLDLDLNLEPGYVNDPETIDSEQTQAIAESAGSVLTIFEAYNGKLLILGDAGTGKSTLLLALARELLYQASEDEDFPIPVVLNLASWNAKLSMADWLVEELNEKYQVPQSVAKRWVRDNALLLLLDGLDEVREEYRQNCMDEINAWCDEHPFGDVVVSSRPVDYQALSGQLHLNGCVVIQALSNQQVDDYLDTIGTQTAGLQTILEYNPEMRELSKSPLMLGIMLTAYQEVTVEQIPEFNSADEQRNYFFDLYIKRAWERRNAEKLFSLDDIKNWFSRLASKMSANSQTMFLVEELQPGWLLSGTERRFRYYYALIMMLIFSATWYIASALFLTPDEHLYYAAMGAVWGWALFYSAERFGIVKSLIAFLVLTSILRISLDSTETIEGYFQKSVFRSTLPYTLILWIMMSLYHRTGQSMRRIHSVDALNWSFKSTRWVGFLAGMAGGFLVSIPNIFIDQDFAILEIILKFSVSGFLGWFFTGFRANRVQQSAEVNEKIHRSLRNGLKMGLFGGLAAMFIIATAFYPEGFDLAEEAPALFNFLPMAMTALFAYGGAVVIQHYLLRRNLVQQEIIPQNLIPFLQEGVQLGVMRRVGGGFIFIHRYILEYFASQSKETSK